MTGSSTLMALLHMVREDQGTIGCTHLKLAVRRTGQGHGDGKIFAQVIGRKGVSKWQITLDNAASYTANEPARSAVQQNAFADSPLIDRKSTRLNSSH